MSSGYGVAEVLNPRFIQSYYEEIASIKASEDPFLSYWDSVPAEDQQGDQFEIVYYPTSKKPSRINKRGGQAIDVDLEGVKKYHAAPIHVFNRLPFAMDSYQWIREPDSEMLQNKGQRELDRQMREAVEKVQTLKKVCIAKALVDGVLYFDAAGNILESSSGAAITLDLQVDATHKSQLAHASNSDSDIIDTAWDQAGANILEHLDKIREAAEHDNAEEPRHVWLHTTAKQWFRANTELKAYMENSQRDIDSVLRGNVIEDLNGFTFHFLHTTYTDSSGTIRPLIPKTKAVITPDVGNWFLKVQGDTLVPNKTGVVGTLQEGVNSLDMVYGDFAYVNVSQNPIGLEFYHGARFLYCFRNPGSVWMPTVDF